MKLKVKIIWLLFYLFALSILLIIGEVKLKHIGNFWKECLNIIKRPSSSEDSAYILKLKK